MAILLPFRGCRYNSERAGNVTDLVTQPYDKISPEMASRYLESSPYNIVRIIKNSDYEEAGRALQEWLESGVLQVDSQPAFYPYEQIFDFQGRTWSRMGLIALVSLDDPDLAVKGHENILKAPLEDRLNLIRRTECNEGLIFTLFSDPAMEVDGSLEEFTSANSPEIEMTDEHGVTHRLWRLTEPALQELLATLLADKPLYIADGHHRFQTSLLYHRECLEQGWRPAAVESFDKRLMALFNLNSPALKILPTHRAIQGVDGFESKRLLQDLESSFLVEESASLADLEGRMSEPGHKIGLLLENQRYLLTLKSEVLTDSSFMPELRGAARDLDVNILHQGILAARLDIDTRESSGQKYVDYFRDSRELDELVVEGHRQAGFLLKPTRLEQVQEISELGEKMPQKSTDFYPKLLTGLVMMKMQIDKG